MSAPDRALQNLNLDEMPVTRSSARSVGEGRGRELTHTGSRRMNPLARPTQSSISRYPAESSHRGLQAAQMLSHQTHYPGDFVVVNVKRINTTFDFTLVPAIATPSGQRPLPPSQSIRGRTSNEQACVSILHDPIRKGHQASCNFQGHASNPICVHILWLIGRLHVVLRKMKPTTAENVNQQVSQLHERMKDMTNNDLLQCVRTEDGNADMTVPLPSVKAEEQQARRANLCDILSSFDEDETPEGFFQHVSHGLRMPTNPSDVLVESELPATMFRLAMRDDYIYSALYNLVPGDIRARKCYETQFSRAVEVLQRPEPVRQAVRMLRKIVHEMYEDRSERREQFPQDPQETIDAILAEILMNVVGMVVNDQDDAEGSSQEGLHNMYVHLIRNPRRGTQGMEGWMKDMFVLDRYQELWNRNQQRLNHRWPLIRQRWESILRRIHETTTSEYRSALLYAEKIEEIIQELNGRPSDPSESAQRLRMPQIDEPDEDDDEDEPF